MQAIPSVSYSTTESDALDPTFYALIMRTDAGLLSQSLFVYVPGFVEMESRVTSLNGNAEWIVY